jgi:hypothetical protein
MLEKLENCWYFTEKFLWPTDAPTMAKEPSRGVGDVNVRRRIAGRRSPVHNILAP